jgi:hypothetical protein
VGRLVSDVTLRLDPVGAPLAPPDHADGNSGDADAPLVSARARAIWGLVDDAYGLVGRTDTLAPSSADAVATAVAIGNPAFDVADAVAVLHDPAIGWLCARAFTDARRDSHGRGVLVTDVVVLDDAAMTALRRDPFRCLPRARRDRRPEREGMLDLPTLRAMSDDGEARCIAAALARPDAELLPTVLAALLAGDRVLWVGDAPALPLLQALVLLLPVPLRGALTLQTLAVQPPRLAPRLTVAPRLSALLAEVSWSVRLPEQAAQLPPRARALADALLALGADAPALQAAHARYARVAGRAAAEGAPLDPRGLGVEVDRLLRLAALDRAARRGAAADALRALVPTAPAAERAEVAESLAALAPETLASGVAELLAHGDGAADLVAGALAELARLDPPPAGAPRLRAVLRRLPAGTALDGDGRVLRAVLAAIAAWDDDVAGMVAWAVPDADWAWLDARLGWPAAGAAPARTRTLLAALAGGPEAAPHVAHALAGVAPTLPLPARRRAAALGLAAVRRAFAARDGSDAGALEGAARAASALRTLWRAAPAPAEVRPFAALLGAPESERPTTRLAAVESVLAAVRAAPGGDVARGRELNAWTAALLSDALAAPGAPDAAEALDAAARLVARGFEEGVAGPDAPGRLGALLRTALPDGPPADAALASHWAAVLAHADAGARGELTLRALLAGRAARPPRCTARRDVRRGLRRGGGGRRRARRRGAAAAWRRRRRRLRGRRRRRTRRHGRAGAGAGRPRHAGGRRPGRRARAAGGRALPARVA